MLQLISISMRWYLTCIILNMSEQAEEQVMVDCVGERVSGVQDYALIGNLRTAALVSKTGSIESMCVPYFDSPSVFARVVDADKGESSLVKLMAGGHFSIKPTWAFRSKQAYAPNSNVLVTKFLSEQGVLTLTDFLVPKGANKTGSQSRAFLPWLVRKVESIRGKVPVRMECAPAFNYCRDKHTAELIADDTVSSEDGHKKALFDTPALKMDLRYVAYSADTCTADPSIELKVETLDRPLLGPAVISDFELEEGQAVYFCFRETGDWEYATEEHQRVANPKPERAETLGVPLDRLLDATSRLRPKQNPLLTKVCAVWIG